MIPLDIVIFLVFVILLTIYFYRNRQKIQVQDLVAYTHNKTGRKFSFIYVAMYRSRFGINLVDRIVKKYPRTINAMGSASLYVGIIGMIVIIVAFVFQISKIFYAPQEVVESTVKLVLPFKTANQLYVPVLMWIITIFIVAVVHEGGHALVARVKRLPLKSTGFASLNLLFVPIVPMAYVDINEQALSRKTLKDQLKTFAAGPAFNVFLCIPVFLLLIITYISLAGLTIHDGFEVVELISEQSKSSGIKSGDIITHIDGYKMSGIEDFTNFMLSYSPGDLVQIVTNRDTAYTMELGASPQDETAPYLGMSLVEHTSFKESVYNSGIYLFVLPLKWLQDLLLWVFTISLGIGLFNLLPIGPLDGGRMLKAASEKLSQDHGVKIWKAVSFVFLVLVIMSMFAPKIASFLT